MADNRTVLAGSTIPLRVRFRDDTGLETTATNVYVHIFDSDAADTDNLANATLVSGVAVDLGENIWEFQYTVPSNGPSGTWHDKWQGDITYQGVEQTLAFEVVASGFIEDFGTQLNKNNVVTVTLSPGIAATDTSSLEEEFQFSFLTKTNPSYANLRKVQLEAGGFISNVPDDTVQLAILEASLEADTISFQSSNINTVFQHARRQYTSCLASQILVHNIGIGLKSKRLADLKVDYDSNSIRDAMARFMECMDKWEPQVIAGGQAKSAGVPVGVVKGSKDPDKPIVSRGWDMNYSRGQPGANTRALPTGSRRFVRTWSRSPSFKKRW